MKTLTRLWALLLIAGYLSTLALPAVALATTAPFPTCTINIHPNVVAPGGSATLDWSSTDANPSGNSIVPTYGTVNLDNIPQSGSQHIVPPLNQITTYIGTFVGPGGTANCTASVQVSYGTASGGDVVAPNPTPSTVTQSGGGSSGSGAQQPALVTCGTGIFNGNGGDQNSSTGCQACNLAQLASNIINFMIGVSIPIAALLFAWAGILYFTSGARPDNKNNAKDIFSNALIGFVIVITAWLVINTLLHVLLDKGQAGFTQGNWFTIQCDTLNRPVNGNINDVLSTILPNVNTQALQSVGPITTTGGGPQCPSGFSYSASVGSCSSNTEPGFTLPNGYSCPTGSTFAASADNPAAGSCVNDLDSTLKYPPVSDTGTVAGSSESMTVKLSNGSTQTFSCADCAPLPSDLPGYNRPLTCSQQVSGACQADAGLINSLQQFNSNYSGSWYVSEAWPPTTYHASTDQNAGASIDISACNQNNGATDASTIGSCVQTVQTTATQSNLRAVYEVPTAAQQQAIIGANPLLTTSNVIVVPYITGSHFSIYKQP